MVSGTSIPSYPPAWPQTGARQVSGSGSARSTASAQRTSLDVAGMGGKLRIWVPGSAHPRNRDTPLGWPKIYQIWCTKKIPPG